MQANRLFQIIYILLDKKGVTAKYLSEKFEVSTRTIYRDIEVLSSAGIPIYTTKGKNGGIHLLDNYILNKTILSEEEQKNILASLQGLKSLNYPNISSTLDRLTTLFNKNDINWIDVDFSNWSGNEEDINKFELLKTSIINTNVLTFDYFSSYKEKTFRTVEPYKLLFKGQAWYLLAYCRNKNDFRVFKVNRMKNVHLTKDVFKRKNEEPLIFNNKPKDLNYINIKLKINASMAYRIYDEFTTENIIILPSGDFEVSFSCPFNQWIYDYIFSFGSYVEVLEPSFIREEIIKKLKTLLNKYS